MKISILIPTGILLAVYWIRYFGTERKKGVPFMVPLIFTCLFIPKLNLIRVNRIHYNTAGIRLDDILTLILFLAALRDSHTWKNKYIKWGLGFLAALSAVNLISMFAGRANGFDNAVMFSVFSIVRKYEYFAFALIGIYVVRRSGNTEELALKEFTWMNCFHAVIGLLQILGLCNVAAAGKITDHEYIGFAVSTFNGYYEYGQYLCFAVVIYLCVFLRTGRNTPTGKKLFSAAMLLVSFIMIWLTKSRSSLLIAILLTIIILVFSVRKISYLPVKIGVCTGLVLFAVAGILFAAGAVKIGRFDERFNLREYADVLQTNIEHGDLRQYVKRLKEDVYLREPQMVETWIADGSASIRFYKWGAVLDGFRHYPLFGYGTGVTRVVDGNYVKLLGETGIIGTVLWLTMFGYFMHVSRKAGKKIPSGRCVFWMMASVLMASVFIDMFEASRPMEMLWLAVGLVIALDARNRTDGEEEPQYLPEPETSEAAVSGGEA